VQRRDSKSLSLALAGTSLTSCTIAVIALLGLGACTGSEPAVEAHQAALRPTTAPVQEAAAPLSTECAGTVKLAEKQGLIRPGTIDAEGAVVLTDARWATRLDAALQEQLAQCVSHYIAGGQNRWTKRVEFRNQATGVVYATMRGDRFHIGK
jgi:uncharacterized lipoprotein YmbA